MGAFSWVWLWEICVWGWYVYKIGIWFGVSANYNAFKKELPERSRKRRKREHIHPILKQLNWLPVGSKSIYKIMLQSYKILNGLLSSYVRELLTTYVLPRSLISASQPLVVVPQSKAPTENIVLSWLHYSCRTHYTKILRLRDPL